MAQHIVNRTRYLADSRQPSHFSPDISGVSSLWQVISVVLGFSWLVSGWQKFMAPAGADASGSASWLVRRSGISEMLLGAGLFVSLTMSIATIIIGILRGNLITAGATHSAGLLVATAVLLILAWKTAE